MKYERGMFYSPEALQNDPVQLEGKFLWVSEMKMKMCVLQVQLSISKLSPEQNRNCESCYSE